MTSRFALMFKELNLTQKDARKKLSKERKELKKLRGTHEGGRRK
jgi:hypothetical protein